MQIIHQVILKDLSANASVEQPDKKYYKPPLDEMQVKSKNGFYLTKKLSKLSKTVSRRFTIKQHLFWGKFAVFLRFLKTFHNWIESLKDNVLPNDFLYPRNLTISQSISTVRRNKITKLRMHLQVLVQCKN